MCYLFLYTNYSQASTIHVFAPYIIPPPLNPLPTPQTSYSPLKVKITVIQSTEQGTSEFWFRYFRSKTGLVGFVYLN